MVWIYPLRSGWPKVWALEIQLQPMLENWENFSIQMSSKRFLSQSWNVFDFFWTCESNPQLSPGQTNEGRLHDAAKRAGLTFPCSISYLDIPICSGYDCAGKPIAAVVQWPFLLPGDMEPCMVFILHSFGILWGGKELYFPSQFSSLYFTTLRRKPCWMKGSLRRWWTWRSFKNTGSGRFWITLLILRLQTGVQLCRLHCMEPWMESNLMI